MATVIAMPQLGESVTEGTIGRWLKAVGERVERDEPLVEVITDKVNVEIPSPAAGVLTRIAAEEGQTVAVGSTIAELDGESAGQRDEANAEGAKAEAPNGGARSAEVVSEPAGAPPRASAAASAPAPAAVVSTSTVASAAPSTSEGQPRTSPLVRRLAKEHGLDLSQIQGSGLGGRVTREDVLAYLEKAGKPPSTAAAAPATPTPGTATPSAPTPAPAPPPTTQTAPSPPSAPAAQPTSAAAQPAATAAQPAPPPGSSPRPQPPPSLEGWQPLSPQRRAIAEHMVRAVSTQPHVTLCIEIDVTGVAKAREAVQAEFQRREGFELTYLPFVARAVVEALREHPMLNSAYQTNDRGEPGIVVHRQINLGIAVALEDGLLVPVIRDADALSVAGLARAARDLAVRARSGKLAPDDVRGGTFTLNNTGAVGSLRSNPIINGGQAAIITMEAVVRRPVVVTSDGEEAIAIRSIMGSCLTFDHRVLDGLPAGRFMQSVKRHLETFAPGQAIY